VGTTFTSVMQEKSYHFHYFAVRMSIITFEKVVGILFYQNKKMLFIINNTYLLMNGTDQAGSGNDRWRGAR
jgi:hypothetical protein